MKPALFGGCRCVALHMPARQRLRSLTASVNRCSSCQGIGIWIPGQRHTRSAQKSCGDAQRHQNCQGTQRLLPNTKFYEERFHHELNCRDPPKQPGYQRSFSILIRQIFRSAAPWLFVEP